MDVANAKMKEKRGSRRKSSPVLLFAPAIAAITGIGLLVASGELSLIFVLKKGLYPLVRLLTIMAASLGLSALIEGMGWSEAMARLTRPLMRFGGFGSWTATAFVTAFVSGIAANTMIWNAYQENKMEKKEMILAVFLNVGLPSYVLHLPTTLAIILPLVGKAGLIYMGITFVAAVLRSAAVMAAGRIFLRGTIETSEPGGETEAIARKKERSWDRVTQLYAKFLKKRLIKIAAYTIPIYIVVLLLQHYRFFDWLQDKSLLLFPSSTLPVEGISVVVFSIIAEFTAGAAAAGAMLSQGMLTVNQTVLALVLGNIIATPFRAIRHQLPRYLGIFKIKTGLILLFGGQALRVVSVVAAAWIYFYFTAWRI